MNTSIVIAVNKKDVWFCRICVASIRYYYPHAKIYLLKDELNGKFSTSEIARNWNVELIEYPVKKFGWSAAKIHFYCDKRFAGGKFLVLDSDIVFTGKILDNDYVNEFLFDAIVSEETTGDPMSEWFKNTYFDYQRIQRFDPEYTYAGFTFNCGQLFCKGNFLNHALMEPYFDFNAVPAWKQKEVFPLVDQSVLNYLLPKLANEKKLQLSRQNYMIWSETATAKGMSLEEIKNGNKYPYLIHWAGALRIPLIGKMTRGDILLFFEKHYYSKIAFGYSKRFMRKAKPYILYCLKSVLKKIKRK
jgi:lipopolysaccharide biosynthesis glycosyltransferase